MDSNFGGFCQSDQMTPSWITKHKCISNASSEQGTWFVSSDQLWYRSFIFLFLVLHFASLQCSREISKLQELRNPFLEPCSGWHRLCACRCVFYVSFSLDSSTWLLHFCCYYSSMFEKTNEKRLNGSILAFAELVIKQYKTSQRFLSSMVGLGSQDLFCYGHLMSASVHNEPKPAGKDF